MNNFTGTELEAKWLSLLVGVEDLAVNELSDVTHTDAVTLLGSWSSSELLVIDLDALDSLDTESGLALLGWLSSLNLGRAGWALLKVLSELDLLVALSGFIGLGLNSLTLVVLELLLLLLAELLWFLSGRLGHDGIKGVALDLVSRALLVLLVSLDKLWGLIFAGDLGDSWVLKTIKIIALIILELKIKLILIWGEVVILIVLVILRIVDLVVVVVSIIVWNQVVTSKMDGVGAGNLEENALVLTDSDVKSLLVVL